MAKLSQEKIQEIIAQYPIIGTYSGVAKKLGVSPATVKKYITQSQSQTNVFSAKKKERVLFNEVIPDVDKIIVPHFSERGVWLELTSEELLEIERLREEI